MRIIFNELEKTILAIVEDEGGTVTGYPPGSAVIQGSPEYCFFQAMAAGLDASQIPGSFQLSDHAKLAARQHRCKSVRQRFLVENISVTIAPEQSGAMLNAFVSVMLLLENGDAKTALGAIMSIPGQVFPVTKKVGSNELYADGEERKQTYVAELQKIVVDLFE